MARTTIANDTELSECLVEQNESDVHIHTQTSVANVASHNVPNTDNDIPMDFCDNENGFLTAVHKLQTIASQNSFTIHDVPYDGNSMC